MIAFFQCYYCLMPQLLRLALFLFFEGPYNGRRVFRMRGVEEELFLARLVLGQSFDTYDPL